MIAQLVMFTTLEGVSDPVELRQNVGRLTVDRHVLSSFAVALHEKHGFDHCSLISAVDYRDRFEIVYHLSNLAARWMLELRVTLPHENPHVDSVATIWEGADWHEREAWDMMGIQFVGHPNLKRVLLPDDFQGHPLRKDYTYAIHEEEW